MIYIEKVVVNSFFENTYIVYDQNKECVIIDPGCYSKNEKDKITSIIDKYALKVKLILNTHCHIDHILGNKHLKDTYKVSIYAHTNEMPVFEAATEYANALELFDYVATDISFTIKEGDIIEVGNMRFNVIYVHGHSPGHLAFYIVKSKYCFSGDVIFVNSIGRTDLIGGDYNTLMESINNKIVTLGDDVVIYPGHGRSTSVGQEKQTNPYLWK